MYLTHYKALYRRVVRLPLDNRSLNLAQQKLRAQFTLSKHVPTFSVVNRKLYDRAISVLDGILVDEKYKDFEGLLDLIYRDLVPRPSWIEEFHHTKYSAFKSSWPQVHLIDEFGDTKSKELYRDALAKMQPRTEFSFMRALNIPHTAEIPTLVPLKQTNKHEDHSKEEVLLQKMLAFHRFLKNHPKLSDTQIHTLEALYEPNRYGLPPSIATMEAELKKKVNYAKHLLDTFRPLEQNDLAHLIAFATSKESPTINPAFFRYMLRKRAKEKNALSPAVQKYVRHKSLIANDRNILHLYRQYVVRQFYVDENGEYTMSPMRNLYD